MNTWKKWTVLLSTLALSFTLAAFAACKEEETPPPPSGGDETAEFIFPDDDATIVWKNARSGDGAPDNRFQVNEGYYKASLSANSELFYSFDVDQTGLYALYTMSAVEGVTITQYDANEQYIPTDDDGNYIGTAAVVVPQEYGDKAGVLYSKINCSAKYYSDNWRATYGIKSTTAQTVEIRFVRIGEPLREPEDIVTAISAQELKGKFYADPNEDTTGKNLATVPWSAEYFYDENYEIEVTPFAGGDPVKVKGFYRMGTKDEPKGLIYAMLTEVPTRMFDTTFTELLNRGTSLRLYTGTAENGDILYNDYESFIMKGEGDATKACYENAVSADGLYPVNKELYDFLNYYVDARGCSGMTMEERAAYPDAMWLAPCYYYGKASDGTQAYPYELSLGQNSVTLQKEDYVFYNVKWERELNANTNTYINDGYYRIICENPDVVLKFTNDSENRKNYTGTELSDGVVFETDAFEGVTIMFLYTGSQETATVDVTIEKVAAGYPEKPNATTLNSFSMTTSPWLSIEGETEYFVAYSYTAAATGTLTVSASGLPQGAELTVNDTVLTDSLDIEVSAGDVVQIVFTGTATAQTITVQLSLS